MVAKRLQRATAHLGQAGMANPDEAGAGSADYLRLFALVAFGFMWAQMAKIALARLDDGADDAAFYETKLTTARFFMERLLPDTSALAQKVTAGAGTMMSLDAERF